MTYRNWPLTISGSGNSMSVRLTGAIAWECWMHHNKSYVVIPLILKKGVIIYMCYFDKLNTEVII